MTAPRYVRRTRPARGGSPNAAGAWRARAAIATALGCTAACCSTQGPVFARRADGGADDADAGAGAAAGVLDDEFVGPFPSWLDVRRDFGAAGDGTTDDTAALQRALDALGSAGRAVAFVPAGTYRITQTLVLASQRGVALVGEDPARTTVRWDGAADGVMFSARSVSRSRFARLTWDGAGRAAAAVELGVVGSPLYGGEGSNEHADEIFRDVALGVRSGPGPFTDPEDVWLRCRFVRCAQAGAGATLWNGGGWWVWDSEFDACGAGVTNLLGSSAAAGSFVVRGSVFRGSAQADVAVGSQLAGSVRDSVSVGSRAFVTSGAIGANTIHMTLQGNGVLDPASSPVVQIDNLGPLTALDNVVRTDPAVVPMPAVRVWGFADGMGDLLAIGNVFAAGAALQARGRMVELDGRIVPREQIAVAVPAPAHAPPNRQRVVFEVPPGADAAAMQRAIDAAVHAGDRAVVHVPAGDFALDQTLVVPAGTDVQLVGDGPATVLRWQGAPGAAMLRITGPTRARVRDLALDGAGQADGLDVDGIDQPGGLVLAHMLRVDQCEHGGVWADGLDAAQVLLRALVADGSSTAVRVVGGPAGAAGASRVAIVTGAERGNVRYYEVSGGGRLVVHDVLHDEGSTPISPGLARLTDAGSLTVHGGQVNTPGADSAIEVDGFRGALAVINFHLNRTRLHVVSGGADTRVLGVGLIGAYDDFFVDDAPTARVGLLHSYVYRDGVGSVPVPDRGETSAPFVDEMLQPTRAVRWPPARPLAGATDLRVSNVSVHDAGACVHLRR